VSGARSRGSFALATTGLLLAGAGFARIWSCTVQSQYRVVAASSAVDMNRADAAALERLPGIGPVLAERIVSARMAGGAFAGFGDLRARVEGIGPGHEQALQRIVSFER
jgi:DNA uptake protein ComE-like DNA-binding protein